MSLYVLCLVIVCVALSIYFPIRAWIDRVDATNPRHRLTRVDHVAEGKRHVTHRGFKSQVGIRDRRCL